MFSWERKKGASFSALAEPCAVYTVGKLQHSVFGTHDAHALCPSAWHTGLFSRRQMLKYSFHLCKILCQGPTICACHSSYIFENKRLHPTLEVCALESRMKVSITLRAAVIPRPQPWGFYPRCQLTPLRSRTSLDPRSSLCSQAFTES